MRRSAPEASAAPPHRFDLGGGALCLDFANTVGDRPRRAHEHLGSYGDLLSWGRQAAVLGGEGGRRLASLAARRPGAAKAALRRALVLRETIYRVFSSLAAGRRPPGADLEALNRFLREAMRFAEVVGDGSASFCWGWRGLDGRLDGVLWPVARSAADLLTAAESRRIRECASPNCSWLFVDCSRARTRRWCDMSTCGNRAKARRHYRKKKRAASQGS